MRSIRIPLFATLFLLGTFALVATAGDGSAAKRDAHFIINAKGAGNADLKLDELAEGETRSFTTDEGKPIEITRTKKGYSISVDGKVTEIDLEGGDGYAFHVGGDGVKSGEHRIVVMQGGEQGATQVKADGKHVLVVTGDGEHHVDGGKHVVIVGGDGEATENGAHVIQKKIITRSGDGPEREVKIHVIGGEGEEVNIEDLEDLDINTEDGGHVVIIRKKVVAGEGDGQQEKVEVRIEVEGDEDGDQP